MATHLSPEANPPSPPLPILPHEQGDIPNTSFYAHYPSECCVACGENPQCAACEAFAAQHQSGCISNGASVCTRAGRRAQCASLNTPTLQILSIWTTRRARPMASAGSSMPLAGRIRPATKTGFQGRFLAKASPLSPSLTWGASVTSRAAPQATLGLGEAAAAAATARESSESVVCALCWN